MFRKGRVKRQVKKALALGLARELGYTGKKRSEVDKFGKKK